MSKFVIRNTTTQMAVKTVQSEAVAFQLLSNCLRLGGHLQASLTLSADAGFTLSATGSPSYLVTEQRSANVGRPASTTVPIRGVNPANPLAWNGRPSATGWYGHKRATRNDPVIDTDSPGELSHAYMLVYTDVAGAVLHTMVFTENFVRKLVKAAGASTDKGSVLLGSIVQRHVDHHVVPTCAGVLAGACAIHLYSNGLGYWNLFSKRYVG